MTMGFDFDAGTGGVRDHLKQGGHNTDDQFEIGIIGDFSGRSACDGAVGPSDCVRVDLDTLDRVMQRVQPRVCTTLEELGEVCVEMRSIEDFHPDALLKNVKPLAELMDLKKKLAHQSTYQEAAAIVQQWQGVQALPETKNSDSAEEQPQADSDNPFSALLGAKAHTTDDPKPQVDITKLIKSVLGSSALPDAAPEQGQLISIVEARICLHLKQLLDVPAFQSVERAWLGLSHLLSTIELDQGVLLRLIDCSMPGMQQEQGLDRLRQTLLGASQAQGGQALWSLLISVDQLGADEHGARIAGQLASIAKEVRAPIILGINPAIAGCQSARDLPNPEQWVQSDQDVRQAWDSLRQAPQAAWLGLTAPRFMLRHPYGPQTEPVDVLDFCQITDPDHQHESYLWCAGAVLCAQLLAQAFIDQRWSMTGSIGGTISELPMHACNSTTGCSEDTRVTPSGEGWLTERSTNAFIQAGLIPVQSVRNRNEAQVGPMQSIVGRPLLGRWS